MIFLIEYDRSSGTLVSKQQFPAEDRGLAERSRLEREIALNAEGVQREVVLLEAADEAALQLTHSRYFRSLQEISGIPSR